MPLHKQLITLMSMLHPVKQSLRFLMLHHRRTANSSAAHARLKKTNTALKPPRQETSSLVEVLEFQRLLTRVDQAELNKLHTEEERRLQHAPQPMLVVQDHPQAAKSVSTCQLSVFESAYHESKSTALCKDSFTS